MHTSHTNSCFFQSFLGDDLPCVHARPSIPKGFWSWLTTSSDSSSRFLTEMLQRRLHDRSSHSNAPSTTNFFLYKYLLHTTWYVQGHPYVNSSRKSVKRGKMCFWQEFTALCTFMLSSTFTFCLPPYISVVAQVVLVQAETGNSNMIHSGPAQEMLFAVMLWRPELNEACLFNASLPQPQLKMLCGMFDFGGETRNIVCQTWAR